MKGMIPHFKKVEGRGGRRNRRTPINDACFHGRTETIRDTSSLPLTSPSANELMMTLSAEIDPVSSNH